MLVGVDDRHQRLGVKPPQVSHLDDQTRDRLEEAAALEAFAVVAWDYPPRCDGAEEVHILSGHPTTTRARRAFIDLLVFFDQGREHIIVVLDEFRSILGLHLFEVHDESILAVRGG